MDREPVLHLQPAPGADAAQHGSHQLQPDIERHHGPIVKAVRRPVLGISPGGGEQPGRPEPVHRRLDTGAEAGECRHLRLAHRQLTDARLPGEGLDRPETGRLDFAVVTDGALRASGGRVFVAVGGVVHGQAVDVGRHAPIVGTGPHPDHGDPRRLRYEGRYGADAYTRADTGAEARPHGQSRTAGLRTAPQGPEGAPDAHAKLRLPHGGSPVEVRR